MEDLIQVIEKMSNEKLLNAYNHLLELDQENELVIERISIFHNEIAKRGLE